MEAVFIDTDQRFTYVTSGKEWDLGHCRPDKYIWATRQDGVGTRKQVCAGGGFYGNTLSWPRGAQIPNTQRKVTNQLGHEFYVSEYEQLPADETLRWLGRALKARTYKTRASFEQHFVAA